MGALPRSIAALFVTNLADGLLFMATITVVQERSEKSSALVEALRSAGGLVVDIHGKEEALRRVMEQRADVVVLDSTLDDRDAESLCREMRAEPRTQDVATIRLAGALRQNGDRRRALQAGVDVFMEAPFQSDELLAQVERLLRGRRQQAERDHKLADAERLRPQLEAVFQAMSDGVTAFDQEGNVVLVNRAQARINGFATPDDMKRNLDFFAQIYELTNLDGTVLPVDQWPVSRVMRGESLDGLELKGLRRDTGQEWFFRYSGEPVRDASGRQILTIIITRDITTQKLIEERLTEAKEIAERHRVEQEAIFNSMTEGLVVFDPEGQLLDMNPAALAIHRFKSVEAVRMQLAGFPNLNVLQDLDGRCLSLEEWPISRALRGETFSGYEVQVFPTDGSEPWVGSYGGTPVVGPDGKMRVGIVTLRDITAQKRAEEKLRLHEAALREAQRVARIGNWAWDPATDVMSGSAELWRVLGFEPATGMMPRFHEQKGRLFSSEDWCRVQAEMQQALETGVGYELDVKVTRADHTDIWITMRGEVTRDAQHRSVGLRGTVQDITTRKQAEAALRDSEERFRTYAETMPHLAFITDAAGNVIYGNRRFAEYFGLEPAQTCNWAWQHRQRAYHPDDLGRAIATWSTALKSGEPFEVEYRLRRHDGEYRWHLTRALPLRDAGDVIEQWIATSTDITEQKQAAAELVRARDALARANADLEKKIEERTARLRETVADLEHFSYTLTHDLRAPLRAMHGFGDLLSRRYDQELDPAGRDYLRRIIQAAARMDQLITDALNYSKVVQAEFPLAPVDPAALLRDMIESYPEFQPPRAEILLAGELPRVWANRAGLTQCFSNLLSNAVKFVAPGLTPCVRVRAELRAGRVRLWFEDNGIGISPEQQRRIFGMFQRLSTAYPGTGVGLALVQKVVERMRGEVGVESAEGAGSRFWVEFAPAPDLD